MTVPYRSPAEIPASGIREDFEALLNATREESDQTPLEERMLAEVRDVKQCWGK